MLVNSYDWRYNTNDALNRLVGARLLERRISGYGHIVLFVSIGWLVSVMGRTPLE